jgi:hypothetical protein
MRTKPRATSKSDYPAQDPSSGNPEDRFITANVPIAAAVLSSTQTDSGRVKNPPDRFSPFKGAGAGAISKWTFRLPTAMRAFEYRSITDVVLTIRYTSLTTSRPFSMLASPTAWACSRSLTSVAILPLSGAAQGLALRPRAREL